MNKEDELNKKPLVIYFSAGAMSGVFSAGLSKAFEEAGVKPYVDSVYGNSAGALTSLYFLSNQVELGAALYWDDLNGRKYIKWDRLYNYVLTGFWNYIFGTKYSAEPVFDIDYVERILESKRKINFENIKQSGIDLYFIVYNILTGHHEYLKLQEENEIYPMLRATGGGHPAYPHASHIHGGVYVDGGTIDDERRIKRIIERHPDKEIICVLNNPKWEGTRLSNFFNKIAIGLVMLPFFGWREARKTAKSDFSSLDVTRLKEAHPYLHFIANDLIGYQMSTNAKHHKMLYQRGYELGKEFLLSGELKNISKEDLKL